MKWEKVKLSDCCSSIADGDHQPPPKAESGVPFVTIANINQFNQFDFSNTMFVPQDYYDQLDAKRKAKAGDVLYSVVGSFGIPVLAKDFTPFVFQRHIAILRPNEKLVSAFLYYTMLSKDFYAKADAAALGAAQRTISLNALRNIEVFLPPIDTQKKIVDILSAYDSLIENNQKQIKLLEEAAQRLYKEWFIDLRFPGWEDTPIVDGVPEGWAKTTVERAAAILRRGISPSYDENGDSMVINQKCIRQTVVDLGEARKQTKKYPGEMNLQDGDTVICSTGDGTLGRVGQVFGEYENTTLDSHVTLVRATSDVGAQMLFWTVKSQQAFLQGMGKGSTNQLELNRSVIQELLFILPDAKTRIAFEGLAQAIHNKITSHNKQIIALQTTRDNLLPKLMNGEIEA